MASRIREITKQLGLVAKRHRFDIKPGSDLPEAYRKFWKEWKHMQPAAVHYIPEEGRWKRNEVTGEVLPLQNIPIPVRYPHEFHQGIWGGEAVVQGFVKKHKYKRRIARFWIPVLRRSVVYSEILNVHLSLVVTLRTISQIHENYGFDHYILKTPACDLQSTLALTLKRKMLQALMDNCPAYTDEPEKQQQIYNEYKNYLSSYTPEEIEWYGYTYQQAINKLTEEKEAAFKPQPYKYKYRSDLIEQLKAAKITAEQKDSEAEKQQIGWMAKINPFSKKRET